MTAAVTTIKPPADLPESAEDLLRELGARLIQLDAMLSLTNGDHGDMFREAPEHVQENMLWACNAKAHESYLLLDRLESAIRQMLLQ